MILDKRMIFVITNNIQTQKGVTLPLQKTSKALRLYSYMDVQHSRQPHTHMHKKRSVARGHKMAAYDHVQCLSLDLEKV